jgi:hypothetical protein
MLGSIAFSSQYQQAPVAPEGNILQRNWIPTHKTVPPSFDQSG